MFVDHRMSGRFASNLDHVKSQSCLSQRDVNDPTQRSMIYASYGRDISQEEAIKVGATRLSKRPKRLVHSVKRIIGLISVSNARLRSGHLILIRCPLRVVAQFLPKIIYLQTLFPSKIFEENTRRSKEFEVYLNENLTANQQLRFIVNSILQMGVVRESELPLMRDPETIAIPPCENLKSS